MIEERGRVVALEEGAVWVETLRQSACGACSAQKGCGQSALAKMGQKPMHVRALTDDTLAVGDEITIGIPEDILLKSSLMAYLMPLLAAFAVASAARYSMGTEGFIALGGLLGLALGFLGVHLHSLRVRHDPRYHPVVLQQCSPAVVIP